MSIANDDVLRKALAKPPLGSVPRQPTSVPPMTLEAIIKQAQDRLRPLKSPTLLERLRSWLTH